MDSHFRMTEVGHDIKVVENTVLETDLSLTYVAITTRLSSCGLP